MKQKVFDSPTKDNPRTDYFHGCVGMATWFIVNLCVCSLVMVTKCRVEFYDSRLSRVGGHVCWNWLALPLPPPLIYTLRWIIRVIIIIAKEHLNFFPEPDNNTRPVQTSHSQHWVGVMTTASPPVPSTFHFIFFFLFSLQHVFFGYFLLFFDTRYLSYRFVISCLVFNCLPSVLWCFPMRAHAFVFCVCACVCVCAREL